MNHVCWAERAMLLRALGSSPSKGLGKLFARGSRYSPVSFFLRIKVLPHIINAVILTSAWSAGSTYVFVASRTLYSLALQNQAPRFLTRLSKQGVPWVCVLVTWAVGLLSFLSAGSGGASAAFQWLQNLTALAALNCWCKLYQSFPLAPLLNPCLRSGLLAFAAARMRQAFKKQAISIDSMPFKAPGSPWVQFLCALLCAIIIIFSGFPVFIKGNWDTATFFASYISALLPCSLRVFGNLLTCFDRSRYSACPLDRLQDYQALLLRALSRCRPLQRSNQAGGGV